METKKELRKEILKQRRAMEPALVRQLSEEICCRVRQTDQYMGSTSLCIYMPINNEVEADLLIAAGQADGKRVYVPKVIGEEMVFNAFDASQMVEGPFHIRESASEEVLEPDAWTLIVMPGSVFDLQCHRIGYGGGYYDRYLSRYPMCRTIGVCFDLQIVEELPAEPHDICPEMVVSEKRVLEKQCGGGF